MRGKKRKNFKVRFDPYHTADLATGRLKILFHITQSLDTSQEGTRLSALYVLKSTSVPESSCDTLVVEYFWVSLAQYIH